MTPASVALIAIPVALIILAAGLKTRKLRWVELGLLLTIVIGHVYLVDRTFALAGPWHELIEVSPSRYLDGSDE